MSLEDVKKNAPGLDLDTLVPQRHRDALIASESELEPQPPEEDTQDAESLDIPEPPTDEEVGTEESVEVPQEAEPVETPVVQDDDLRAEFQKLQQQYASLQGMWRSDREKNAEIVAKLKALEEQQQQATENAQTLAERYGLTDDEVDYADEFLPSIVEKIAKKVAGEAAKQTVKPLEEKTEIISATSFEQELNTLVPELKTLNNDEKFFAWTRTPNRAFGGQMPVDAANQARDNYDAPGFATVVERYMFEMGLPRGLGQKPTANAPKETPAPASKPAGKPSVQAQVMPNSRPSPAPVPADKITLKQYQEEYKRLQRGAVGNNPEDILAAMEKLDERWRKDHGISPADVSLSAV